MTSFASDNAAAICPEVMAALVEANNEDTAYDGAAYSQKLDAVFSELFATPVAALWVSTGTAANALALAALCPPHGAVICNRHAHIQNDECGAPEFYTHGAKLLPAEGEDAKLTPKAVSAVLDAQGKGVHWVQPHALSITNASEHGCVYRPDEVAALGALAREHGLGFHMDGARFANAVAHLECSPADITWKAGVDILSFGFVKNGGMSSEALIFFDPALVETTHARRKRAGHLLSKGRYSAAQILALIRDDLWLRHAHAANKGAQQLAKAARDRLLYPVEANELFVRVSPGEAQDLRNQGFVFYDWGSEAARFVVSYDQEEADVTSLANAFSALY